MDYREQLKNPASIGFIDLIVDDALRTERTDEIFELAFDEDKSVAWRAGWAFDKICRKNPAKLGNEERLHRVMDAAVRETHNGMIRSFLCIINDFDIPSEVSVDFINSCFDRMVSPKVDVSHQVLSMKILYKICLKEPAFMPEFMAYLDNVSTSDYTPGFNSTRRKILKQLKHS